jgi:hypothetical protein
VPLDRVDAHERVGDAFKHNRRSTSRQISDSASRSRRKMGEPGRVADQRRSSVNSGVDLTRK